MGFKYIFSKIIKKGRLSAIKNSRIHKTSKVESGSHIVNTIFEDNSYCGYDCKIYNSSIGKYCSIADNVSIGLPEHPIYWVSTSPVFYSGRDSIKTKYSKHKLPDEKITTIKNDVWIGANVLIKAGVTICDGAIIGMGSVVTKNVGPYEIWAGNPARFIKKRFDDDTIKSLLEINWWDKDVQSIKRNSAYIKEPIKFIGGMK